MPNNISLIEDTITMDKVSLIKIHLFIKLVENSISDILSDRELNILSFLYAYGGITDKVSMEDFSNRCFHMALSEKDSIQSVRNALGKARELGVVKRRKVNNWKLDDNYLPKLPIDNDLVFKYILKTEG